LKSSAGRGTQPFLDVAINSEIDELPKETTSSTGLTSELARTTFWPRRTFQYNWGSISYLEFIDSLKTARNHEKPS